MDVSAVIVAVRLIDAHVLVLLPVHSCLRAVSLEVELLTYVPATEYRSPDHVGRVITGQRTKEVAACCVACAIFRGIVTPSGDNGYFQDWIQAFGHFRACCSDPFSCCDVRRIRAEMREYDPFSNVRHRTVQDTTRQSDDRA